MPKKKAPASKPTGPNKTTSKIIASNHRGIKHTGRKHDNGFLEVRLWMPLWELPLCLFPSDYENYVQNRLAPPEDLRALIRIHFHAWRMNLNRGKDFVRLSLPVTNLVPVPLIRRSLTT